VDNRKHNHCKLSQKAIEWINGELLGDGHLCSYSSFSARFTYSSKHFEYAQYVSDTLKSFGIKQAGRIRKVINKRRGNISYHYQSLRYVELLSVHKKWYPKGKKIVPKNIELTPLVCRQWYIGDGTYYFTARRKRKLKLCSQGFTILDVEWLVKKLNKLGFKVKRELNNGIRFSNYSIKSFLEYIGSCPVECYKYKWNYQGGGF
jgi:hypothetical protein